LNSRLLADIQLVFEKRADGSQYADKISSVELITELQHIAESPWATYNHGHPLSPRQLSSQLAIYGIKSKTVRVGNYDTPKGYALSQFDDAFARYLNPADASVAETIQDEQAPANRQKPSDKDLY
jgi:hypothetical protein